MTNQQPFLMNMLLFPRLLRQVGLPISLDQVLDFTQALKLVDMSQREQVFYTAQSLLVTRQEHLRLFATIFNQFWAPHKRTPKGKAQKAPLAPRHKRPLRPFNIATYMAYKARQADPEIDLVDKAATYSKAEIIQNKAFSQMVPEELETVKQLMQKMRWPISWRRTRRFVPDAHGPKLHLRQVLRSATRHGGVPLNLAWQTRKIKERPLILLADISGSMEKYARLLLQFFYAVTHSLKNVECFVFGTRLTRITNQLKVKNIDLAIDEASHHVVDWSGGTRIGQSLSLFNHEWSRRVLRRGALVLIISDGWERGDVSQLQQEMRYLQHRCHRLIWLNPLLGQAHYQPHVAGMAAALPYIDDFLPIHNLQSLTALAEHLRALQ